MSFNSDAPRSSAALASAARGYLAPETFRKVNLAGKRIFDIAGAFVGIVVLSPMLIGVAVAVKLGSRGPVLFAQERWGRNRKRIRIYKFRSLYVDQCDTAGTRQVDTGDSRVTRVGAFLRKSNIDELPQLFNVLRGDMSLVGPRCHVPDMRAAGMLYEELVPHYHERHAMRPGITGLAQAHGYRGPTVDPIKAKMRIKLDVRYIRRFNLWLDVKVLTKTIWGEIRSGSGF